jgi:hypothetical protein
MATRTYVFDKFDSKTKTTMEEEDVEMSDDEKDAENLSESSGSDNSDTSDDESVEVKDEEAEKKISALQQTVIITLSLSGTNLTTGNINVNDCGAGGSYRLSRFGTSGIDKCKKYCINPE